MPDYNEYGQYMMPTGQMSPRNPNRANGNFGGGPIDIAIRDSLGKVGGGVRGFFNILKNGTKYDSRRKLVSPGDMDNEGTEDAVYEDALSEEASATADDTLADTAGEQIPENINTGDPEFTDFEDAFRYWRKKLGGGHDKIFRWGKGLFTTEYAEEKKARELRETASQAPSSITQQESYPVVGAIRPAGVPMVDDGASAAKEPEYFSFGTDDPEYTPFTPEDPEYIPDIFSEINKIRWSDPTNPQPNNYNGYDGYFE